MIFSVIFVSDGPDLAIIVTLFLASLYACNTSVDAIMKIKSKYEVKRDWQWDPCAPKVHMWQGINCSYDANQSPRIISM